MLLFLRIFVGRISELDAAQAVEFARWNADPAATQRGAADAAVGQSTPDGFGGYAELGGHLIDGEEGTERDH